MLAKELKTGQKAIYATGDFTVNIALSSLALIYVPYFLTQVAGLRPALAGLIPLIGRAVDAFTDPLMGRISDLTPWQWGRRRPYFLLGAAPFGISFSMLWVDVPFASQAANFAYYVAAYCMMSIAMTVLSVPYLALLPEMALDYDERTALNTFRNIGSLCGVFAAIGIRQVAELFGGAGAGFAFAGILYGLVVALPWVAVYRVSFERPELRRHRKKDDGFVDSLKVLWRHASFRTLTAFYLTGRIAMDLVSALMILYFTYWIRRSEDFEIAMFLFLSTVILSLPFWLRFSYGRDKHRLFMFGSTWWMLMSLSFIFAQPDWPRLVLFVLPPIVGLGYAVVDLMPWAMLGEVVDEDDLLTGHRREGLYNGVFTFLRKLGGALGVFLVLIILDVVGFEKGSEQSEAARQTIRYLTALAPAFFLGCSVWIASSYTLTRAAHKRILEALAERDAAEEVGRRQ
jgi:sugar (glycoside-pentoside-hexuronide) transporter